MVANKTEMKVKKADAVAILDNVEKVRGRENTNDMMVVMTPKTTVHAL